MVTTAARLHLGFLDLNGAVGRRFGSIGVALDSPRTRLRLARSERQEPSGLQVERLASLLPRVQQRLGFDMSVAVTVEEAIAAHSGLGSGTQLEMALAGGLAALAGLAAPAEQALRLVARGARSGIGMASFLHGGFLIDGGHRIATEPAVGRDRPASPPPILCRYDFPEDWPFVLIFDSNEQGLHGQSEAQAFTDLMPMNSGDTSRLAQLTLMGLMPALVERNFPAFASSLSEIQSIVGAYFAPAQNGSPYSSPRVAEVIRQLPAAQLGIGQSSWGPTGFVLTESPAIARELSRKLQSQIDRLSQTDPGYKNLSIQTVKARNQGATIETTGRG